MAGTPAAVPGILMKTLGRSTASYRRSASSTDPSVSWAR